MAPATRSRRPAARKSHAAASQEPLYRPLSPTKRRSAARGASPDRFASFLRSRRPSPRQTLASTAHVAMPRAAARTADPPSAEKGPLVFNGKPLVPNGASGPVPSSPPAGRFFCYRGRHPGSWPAQRDIERQKEGTDSESDCCAPCTSPWTDHIYVSAPWDDRDGEPYLIARVLEVVQPTPKSLLPAYVSADAPSSTKSSSRAETPTGKETSAGRVVVSAHELRVRVAYYFRTRDITNRYVADHRLLVAAMHADTVPASYVRGLCTVRHREHIEELDVYKREKDTFYWHQVRPLFSLSGLPGRASR